MKKSIVMLGIGTFILSLIALYNGYPLVVSDTGMYLLSGFESFVPYDRPVTYGLFIRLFSLGTTAWTVVLIQNLITAFVMLEFLRLFFGTKKNFALIYFVTMFVLAMLTGIAWYSNQLMADFLAPITILSLYILLKENNLGVISKISLIAIILFSMVSHFSHLMIASILLSIIGVSWLFSKQLKNILSPKRLLVVAIIVFSGWVVLPTINYSVEKKFFISNGSHVFLMAHLNDAGILKKFLDENCSNSEYKNCKLCDFKDSLPVDLAEFMWSSGIVERTGGWYDSKEEYNKIIYATLKKPRFLLLNLYRSFTYGLIQLTRNDVGYNLTPYTQGSAPFEHISERLPDETNSYLNSKQNKWKGMGLNFETLNTVHQTILLLSVIFLIGIFATSIKSKIDTQTKYFLIFALLAIVINSFFTAGLNAPCERFQARVVWLFPMAIALVFSKNYEMIIGYFRKKVDKN